MKVAIIGGGIGGLAAASLLEKRAAEDGIDLEIDLFEASDRLGGVIQTHRKSDLLMEEGPDCFIYDKRAALEWALDLGLEPELIGTQKTFRQSFILQNNRLKPVPQGLYLMAPSSIFPFLASNVLSWKGKFRTMREPFIPKRQTEEDESLASFVRRRFGNEMLEKVAQPLLAGIYSADPELLSLRATMPKFSDWEKHFGSVTAGLRKSLHAKLASGPRYGLFLSFRNGMSSLSNAAVASLRRTRVHLNQKPSDLRDITADQTILALPGHVSAELLHPIAPDVSNELASIPFASSAVLNLAYDESQISDPLHGIGFVIPSTQHRAFTACSFSHRKFEGRAPTGTALLRAYIGGADHEKEMSLSDDELIQNVHRDLQKILGIRGEPTSAVVSRWKKSMPQYHVGHLERVERIEKTLLQHPNLHLVGNSLKGIGIPDVVASALRAVNQIFPTQP